MPLKTIAVIGGGAAGFFGAIACAEVNQNCKVILYEKTFKLLSKVRISGGGRCNVTHSCFDPSLLIQNYPSGGKELRSAFARFQPRDTIQWFEAHGVALKTEEDGRIFPATNCSETIIHCFLSHVNKLGIQIKTGVNVINCCKIGKDFILTFSNGDSITCNNVLAAIGGTSKAIHWIEALGHTFSSPVPSLFTFNIPSSPLHDLAGICIPKVHLSLEDSSLYQIAPLLITHWGFSGPAVLKLSAWGARLLHEKGYQMILKVNWLPDLNKENSRNTIMNIRKEHGEKMIGSQQPFDFPKNFWKAILTMSGISSESRYSALSNQNLNNLIETLHASKFKIEGKSTNKEEFVTCGGIKLEEVNFKTMESRLCPGLYFAGEILDIDGITGGFNFQSAWTTSWLAGQAMAFH